jgi:hypothetical protein
MGDFIPLSHYVWCHKISMKTVMIVPAVEPIAHNAPISSKLGLRFATQLLMALAVSHFTTAAPHPGPTNNQLTVRSVVRFSCCLCSHIVYAHIKANLYMCIDGPRDRWMHQPSTP